MTSPVDGARDREPQSTGRIYHYPRRVLTAAYLRAAGGLIMVGVPMAIGNPGIAAAIILGGIGLAFIAYGIRTWLRGRGRIRLDDDGISVSGPFARSTPWRELTAAKLSYYSTRRDGTGGWMQLDISGAGGKLTIESTLDGFADVTRRVMAESQAGNIELSASTLNNLRPLGIQMESAQWRVTDRARA